MHFVYVNDLAEASLRAAEREEATGEAFNVAHRQPIAQSALVEALGAAAGIEPRIVQIPREEILAAGGQVMGGNLYFGTYFDMPSITEDVSKTARLLGLEPTDFRAGLETTYEWYMANHDRPDIDYSFEDRLLAGRS